MVTWEYFYWGGEALTRFYRLARANQLYDINFAEATDLQSVINALPKFIEA